MSPAGSGSGRRMELERTIRVDAPPKAVFPLLCPERERDWIDGWDYEMIYSASGFAEPGCVFRTTFLPEGPTVWAFVEHVPDRRVAIFRVSGDLVAIHWTMDLTGPAAGTTAIAIHWTVTGLSDAGNRFIDTQLNDRFHERMTWLEQCLGYYFQTGSKLPANADERNTGFSRNQ
ncbi:MAG: hypothetical protein GYA23_13185 [Methanomicrobiales archaeon]|nr:hypothetical protein [Methanomicrobiales archaeon]